MHKFGFLFLFIFSFVLFFNFPISNVAYAATCASNATGDWNAAGTWTSCGGTVPQAGDTVTIGAHTVTIPSGYTINQVGNVTIQNGGTVTQANTLTQTITGTLTIESGGTLKHTDNATAQDYELDFAVAGLDVQSGGTINVDALGFNGGYYESEGAVSTDGIGKGTGGGGAVYAKGGGGGGYGGAGGTGYSVGSPYGSPGATYGSSFTPNSIGSGGGGGYYDLGGSGGGMVKITVTGGGTATVAGSITADGASGTDDSGGGSGGAVWIDFDNGGTFAGGGSISVDGGSSHASVPNLNAGGTGGGGRIAISGSTSITYTGTYTMDSPGTDLGFGDTPALGVDGTKVNAMASTNVEAATTVTSSSNTVTLSFTPTRAIAADSKIVATFPNGFNVASASGGTCSTMDGSFATAVSGQAVTITRSSGTSQAAAAETCTISNITNPSSTGTTGAYTIQIKNSSNTVVDSDSAVTADIMVSGNGGWDGGGADDDWCTDANWGNNSEPGTSTAVSIDTGVLGAGVTVTTSGCVTEGNDLKFSTMTIGGGTTATLEVQQNINSSSANITIASGGVVKQKNTTTQTITGTLLIQSGGKLTHTDNSTSQAYEVDFSAATITIDSGGSIDADALGYDANQGETGGKGDGNGCAGGGGAHGGNGGAGQSSGGCESSASGGTAYGSITNPVTMGSGGGTRNGNTATTGSQGGGYIKLVATGTLTVNGVITADGAASTGANGGYGFGGGAGGGINISVATIAGTPQSITATGGNASNESSDGGGGSGGVVFINYTTDSSSSGIIDASGITANGGSSTSGGGGGAGVVLVKTPSTDGTLFVKNGATAGLISQQTVSSLTVDSIKITSNAVYKVPSGKTLILDTSTALTNGDDTGKLIIDDGATFTPPTTFTVDNTTVEFHQSATWTSASSTALTMGADGILDFRDFSTSAAITFSTVTVQNLGKITHGENSTAQDHVINLATTTLTIDAGGSIDADAKGYAANNGETGGKGGGSACAAGGGAHGGNGGASQTWGACTSSGGTAYGSSSNPATIGSGGGTYNGSTATTGSQGGGYMKLVVAGTLTINGTITADGEASTGSNGGYGFGGGAGGGINASAATIAGTPQSITATGGASSNELADGGGGGGGRIYFGYSSTTSIGTDNTDVGGGAGNSATAGSAGSETFTQTNNAPTATAPSSISQATDGTGNVTFSTTIADADANSSTVKVEISDNAGVSWYDAQITSVAGAVGSPTVDNDQAYQLRSVTTTSSNALTVVWASQHASNGNGGIDGTDQSDIQVRVTPNDATVDGSVQTSASFSVDNLDPSGLGSFAVSSETTTTSTFSWAVATEANFNHYEIWYGTTQSNVQNRSGATEWDNSDDAALATRTTAATTITGLSINTQYYYKIWAVDNFGNEMTVADITAYTSANTPSTPTVTAASTTSLTVVVAENSNPAITTYAIKVGSQYVQANGSLGASEVWQTYATWGSASGVAATGLSANTQYAVSVKARNGDNDETSLSSSSSKYTLASAVTSVTLSNATSKTSYGLSLAWTNNGQTGVKIDLSSVGGGGACDSTYDVGDYDTASANPSSPRSISAAASTCYKARILSYNGDGVLNSTDSVVSNELTTPAAQVTGLAYSTSDINFITWAWTAVSGATNYKIYRNDDDSLIGETGSSTASYTQTTVTSGGAAVDANTQYTVYARAVDGNGEGIASSSAAAYTTANLPTTLSHDSASQTTDSMKWTWASGGSQQDFYAYMTSPTANSGFITDLFWLVSGTLSANTQYSFFVKSRNAENTQTSAVSASAYTSQSAPTGITFSSVAADSITLTADGTFANLTTGSAGIRFRNTTTSADNTLQVTNWTNSSLSPNTQYSYIVSAKNGDGDETSTVTGSKYTLASAVTAFTVADATTTTTLALLLTWTNNGQTGMKIEQDSGCDGTYDATAIYDNATTNATSPYTVNTGLSANTCYVYKISSYNGDGAINSTSVATSAQITTPPAPPDTFITGGITATAFEINWNAVTGATNYTIYESVSGTSLGSTASTTYAFRDKTPGTAYSYYLRASNANGFSIVSAVIALATVSTAATSGSGGGGSGGGGDTYVEIVKKEEERKVEEARIKTEEEKVVEDDHQEEADVGDTEEERDVDDEGGGTDTDVEEDPERQAEQPQQGNGGSGSGGGGGGSGTGADVIVEEGARFRVEKTFENKEKKEKVASEQEQTELDELALLRRASVSFSDTVASINEDNPIPREFIDFAVRKTQVFGSVLNDQKRGSEKVLSERAKKIARILNLDFKNLPEEERREIEKITVAAIEDEARAALKEKEQPVILYMGNDEFVEVRDEAELQEITPRIAVQLLTEGTDIKRDNVDDRIQLSLDLPLLNDDSDDDGIGVAEELSFGLDLYNKDYIYKVPKIFVHSKYGLSKIKTGKFPTIKLFGGKKGSKVKVSLVSKKDNNKQLYVGEVELDDESKGVITAREVVPDDYYIIALSEDGISELAEIEVLDDEEVLAPIISFSRDELLTRALAGFPEFVRALIEKILKAMANEVKPRLIKGRAAPGSMVFVTWKSLTLSSVVMADASQGEFQVEVPPELEAGDHEAIVYVFDPQKSLLGNVSNLFFKWY